jgi:hypothetical protein
MHRWRILLSLALLILLMIARALPFHNCVIELQPDGKSLGDISAEKIRALGIALASVPLAVLGVLAFLAQRFRAWATPWKFVGAALIIGVMALGLIFGSFHNLPSQYPQVARPLLP